eukprot:m.182638 g.182638  ORF g.182638 m.182638 type:complete len:706 (-) comp15584_c0_seq1:39-2156(-)
MASTEAQRLSKLIKKAKRKRKHKDVSEDAVARPASTTDDDAVPSTTRRKARWASKRKQPEDEPEPGAEEETTATVSGAAASRSSPTRSLARNDTGSTPHVTDAGEGAPHTGEAGGPAADEDEEPMLQPLLAPGGHDAASHRKDQVATRTLPRWIREAIPFPAAVDTPESDGDGDSDADACPFARVGLIPELASALKQNGVTGLFPVQRAVIPQLLRGQDSPMHPGDVCVSAPTGSGKTLTYVLPIVQRLTTRVIQRIRAVVVLPNRDLVSQVKGVFDQYIAAIAKAREAAVPGGVTPLRVAALCGQVSFAKEQALLRPSQPFEHDESTVDVIVATPGRLVDHIRGTAAVTMEHVEILVIDEADRLLSQSYSEWLPTFLSAAYRTEYPPLPDAGSNNPSFSMGYTVRRPLPFIRPCELASRSFVRKLLFSATLSHDPEQLASLGLVFPKLFVADERLNRRRRKTTSNDKHAAAHDDGNATTTKAVTSQGAAHYSIPDTLSEHMVVCGAQHKPLVVLYFLLVKKATRMLVFVSTREAARRLTTLINFYDNVTCAEFSSTLTSQQRRDIITKFNDGSVNVVVCSDAMARGMDLGRVEHVISYDPPVAPQTYVHRVGRTARAGAPGSSYVLLRRQEVLHFKKLHLTISDVPVGAIYLKAEDYQEIPGDYDAALAHLKSQVTTQIHKRRGMAAVSASLAERARKRLASTK